MAHPLRMLAAFTEDPSSDYSTQYKEGGGDSQTPVVQAAGDLALS